MEEKYGIEQCEYIHVHEDIVNQVNEQMPQEETLYDLAELFKIFGDSTRIKILYVLFESEMCVCCLLYTSVREDALTLFGFCTREEKAMFDRLITVSGIGPKVALSILSAMSASETEMCIRDSSSTLLFSR